MSPEGHTLWVCTFEHAERAFGTYQKFIERPGPAIIGAMAGASCFGPAYEFAFKFSKDLQRRKLRHKVPITFDAGGRAARHRCQVDHQRQGYEGRGRQDVRTEMDEHGQVNREHELPFAYSMMLPAFKGADAVAQVEMKTGSSEPIYEKIVLKALGIERLETPDEQRR
jgi:sulfide:quinone oxidoreductase